MITVPAHVKNSKIGQDIRRTPGNTIVILRDDRFPLIAKLGRVLISKTFIACLVITTLVLYTSRAPFLKAEATSFYPKACLGGFDAVRNAEGKPDTKVAAGHNAFDIENSAYLSGEQSAEMYCGNFDGIVADHTVPNKITLTIYLTTKEKQDTPVIKNDTSASSTTFLQVLDSTTTPVLENSPKGDASSTGDKSDAPSVIIPVQEKPKESALPTEDPVMPPVEAGAPQTKLSIPNVLASYFLVHVFAEDDAATTQAVAQADTTPKVEADSNAVSNSKTSAAGALEVEKKSETSDVLPVEKTPPVDPATAKPLNTPPVIENASVAQSIKDALENFEVSDNVATSTEHPLFEVAYSLGGDSWIPVAALGKENARTISINLPLETIKSWSDIGKLQVRVKNIDSLDVRDDLYIDGMSLAISYEKDMETTHVRDYVITGIENTGTNMTVAIGGEKGKGSMIHISSKQKAGLAFYNLDTKGLVLTTEVNSDNPSDFDPNGTLPDFGSYVLVLTTDSNWCSGKKLEECVTLDSFKSLTYLDIFPSVEMFESDDVKKLKTKLRDSLTYPPVLGSAAPTETVASSSAPVSGKSEKKESKSPKPASEMPQEIMRAFKNPAEVTSAKTETTYRAEESKPQEAEAPPLSTQETRVSAQ